MTLFSNTADARDSTPQCKTWRPEPYRQALQLFDGMQRYITDTRTTSPRLLPSLPTDDTGRQFKTNYTSQAKGDDRHLQPSMLKEAIQAIQGSLRLYGPEGTFTSFNGGKDATVVVNLHAAVLADYYRENKVQGADLRKPATVYFDEPSDFESVRQFILAQSERLDLDLRVYEGSYKDKIGSFLTDIGGGESRGTWEKHPAFLLGLREGDPGSQNVGVFEPNSAWVYSRVPYMRVHPILKWTYGAVWAYVETFNIPYCILYDEGYTSLGQISETRQNRLLARSAEAGWTPAKYLTEWSAERAGRGDAL